MTTAVELFPLHRRLVAGFNRNPERDYTLGQLVKAMGMPDTFESRARLIHELVRLEEAEKIVQGWVGSPEDWKAGKTRPVCWRLAK